MTRMTVVGKIGAPHGVRGCSKLTSFTHPSTEILEYSPLYVQQNDSYIELNYKIEISNANALIIKVKDVDDREQAKFLTHKLVLIEHSQLKTLPKDEFYWEDLIGLFVEDENGLSIGTVTKILETGSKDVLVIENNDNTILVSFRMGESILKVDINNRILIVNSNQLVFNDAK